MRQVQLTRSPAIESLESRLAPAIINFQLTNDANSTLALSGDVNGATINQQGTNSLKTSYFGKAQVDVDFTNSTIQAIAANSLFVANNSGSWQPKAGGVSGSDPANYGGKVTIVIDQVNFAIRGTQATFSSAALALSGAGPTKTFPSTQQASITSGSLDYRDAFGLYIGTSSIVTTSPVSNTTATNSSFTDNGDGTYSLVQPVDVTINTMAGTIPATYTLKGSINATATLPVVDLNGAAAGTNTTFTTTGAPTIIAPAGTMSMKAGPTMTGLTAVLVSPPDGAFESLSVNLVGTGLSANYNSATGTLDITGTAAVATYQSILQSIKYADAAVNATPGARTITFIAHNKITDSSLMQDIPNDSLVCTATGTLTAAPAHASLSAVNDGAAQRSMVRSATVTFDKVVTFNGAAVNAFQLTGPGGAVTLAADTSGSTASNTIVRLTFSGAGISNGSLADGRYTLTAFADNGSAGVVNFDGDNNGSVGGNLVVASTGSPPTNIFRLYGDADGNGVIDGVDFGAFRAAFNTNNGTFDYDGNVVVDGTDFGQFRSRFGLMA